MSRLLVQWGIMFSILASCGVAIEEGGSTSTRSIDSGSPLGEGFDLNRYVEIETEATPEGGACFTVTVLDPPELWDWQCVAPGSRMHVSPAAGSSTPLTYPGLGAPQVLVTFEDDLTIRRIEQAGQKRPWFRAGELIVFAGASVFSAPTTVAFEVAGLSGTCTLAPSKQECSVDI